MPIKRNIRLLYAISLLQGMVFYGPIATLYRQAAGVSIFQITLIESISMVLCVALELPWGIVADKIGYRRTMLFCCGLYFVSKIVFWQASGFGAFLLERVLLSVVMAGMSGVDASMLYLSCREGQSQRAFSVYNNLGTLGLILAAGIYAFFIKDHYRLAGLMTVFSYGAAAALALGLAEVRPANTSEGNPFRAFRALLLQLLKNKRLLLFLAAVALLNETHQTVTVFLNQLQYTRCGLSDAQIGSIYIAVTVIGLVGGLSARLTDRMGASKLGMLLFILGGAACAVLALTQSAAMSVAAVVILRVAFSLFQPLQMELQNRQITSHSRATALSINAVFINAVAIFTNVAFGRLAEVRLSLAMGLGACLCTLGLLLFLVWNRQGRRKALDA